MLDRYFLQSVMIEVARACCAILLLEPVWAWVRRRSFIRIIRCAVSAGASRTGWSPGHIIDVLKRGSSYERIATEKCSDRTIRRRLKDWAKLGIAQQVHAVALGASDPILGLDLADVSAYGYLTKAPRGEDKAGQSPVDRRTQGLKRSTATEADGVPLGGLVCAGANRHDSPLLRLTLDAAVSQVEVMPEQVSQQGHPPKPSR